MSETNPSTPAAQRAVIAFATPENQKERTVQIFVNRNEKSGSPDFDGKINDKRVGVYIRSGKNGPFLSIIGDKLPDGKYEQLGTANIMAVKGGVAKLAIKLADGSDTIWAEVGQNMSEEGLVKAGLNLTKLAEKKAEANAQGGAAA